MSNHDSYSDSLVALYCLSSDSQHNPRLRSGAGRSIVTTTAEATAARFVPKNAGRTGRYRFNGNCGGRYCARIVGTAPAKNKVRTRYLSLWRANLNRTSSPGWSLAISAL